MINSLFSGEHSTTPFLCFACGKNYRYKHNLNRHMKYECGKRKLFKCCYCGKSFSQKSTLVCHKLNIHQVLLNDLNSHR